MEKNVKKEVKVMTIIKILFVSYIITGILLLILALLLYKLDLGENQVNIGVIAIYLISCFAGGFIAGKRTGSRKFLWGMVVGGAYFAILTIITLALNHTLQGEIGNFFTTLVLCMAGGTLGGMLS
ncbi:TIGR04086 family membrane protein [Diplocloster modestus]|uniref:TIGR04086 family membrane protein n=1 Tax=Diplocloster modestus TaxID=2850322 RepID=A0ABS6KE45_9FIRM|nr:TIGR04086 family membrane protein [Diplocloster modestus]MBU9728796.1 TIGR04086 family membrane protein [Diplocloster modestus]